ncbi:MAG: hypothetical protein K2N84_04240, partial [Clostridia bacterium]|nr:hypothetical protein [Clostridia bacterium]
EGEVTPPSDNTGDDEGEVTPPADNTGDNEGQTTPPVSGSENSNGNTNGSQDSAAGTTGSANGFMGFLQNYWWVLAIAGVVLLVVIFSIVGAKRSKKHKRLVEDKRLQALDEERERQERLEAERKEERRMEQEARMEAMRQQQMMQQQMMPMMPQMMMPQMPMQQQPVQQVQQIPAPQQPNYGGNTPSFELMRMAEEKARAEERARLAEERIMHYMQDQRLRSATNAALPSVQYQQQQPAHDPAEERLRIAEERARKAEQRLLLLEEERLKQQAIQQAPAAQAPQEKPKEVTIKLTDNAVTMLSGALAGLVGAQQVPVQPAQPAPMQGSPVTVQFVQPAAPNVQYVPVQPVQPARPAQTVQPSIAPAAQENGQSEESAPVRRRLRL